LGGVRVAVFGPAGLARRLLTSVAAYPRFAASDVWKPETGKPVFCKTALGIEACASRFLVKQR